MPRSAETYLLEIQRAATYLIQRTAGMDFATYDQDETLSDGEEFHGPGRSRCDLPAHLRVKR